MNCICFIIERFAAPASERVHFGSRISSIRRRTVSERLRFSRRWRRHRHCAALNAVELIKLDDNKHVAVK